MENTVALFFSNDYVFYIITSHIRTFVLKGPLVVALRAEAPVH